MIREFLNKICLFCKKLKENVAISDNILFFLHVVTI